jgi:hypothetical protein
MHTAKALFAYVHGLPEPKPSPILFLSDEPGSDRESLEIGQSVNGGRGIKYWLAFLGGGN